MSNPSRHFYVFGPFRIDVENRLLLRGNDSLPVTPKAVDTLLALVHCAGEVLRRDDLMAVVWPDSVVEDSNLTQNIYLLRKVLGKAPNGLPYIETIPRRGYRFVGQVGELVDEIQNPLPSLCDKDEPEADAEGIDRRTKGSRVEEPQGDPAPNLD